ncbi:MAG: hypothetical protein JWM12_369 [Ilumatobacteraceae bacterium]|nr:hypothetical protein [Ilumatobacteraceae bacterium]
MERRHFPRVTLDLAARVANVSEAIPPSAQVVDISLGGALLACAEPLGLLFAERVVISLLVDDEPILLLGRVVRVARGTDFRTYVAVHFDDGQAPEVERLDELIAARRDADQFVGSDS